VTGRDEPRLKIRGYEKVLPIPVYRTAERMAIDEKAAIEELRLPGEKSKRLGEESVPVSVLQS